MAQTKYTLEKPDDVAKRIEKGIYSICPLSPFFFSKLENYKELCQDCLLVPLFMAEVAFDRAASVVALKIIGEFKRAQHQGMLKLWQNMKIMAVVFKLYLQSQV